MPRLRTIVAFIGAALVALLVALIPGEAIGWFRDWASRDGSTSDDDPAGKPSRRIAKKRRHARSRTP